MSVFKQVVDNAITTTSTTMTSTGVTSIVAASNVFPAVTTGYILTLWNGSDPTLDANMEKVTATANSAGTLTISPTTKTHTNPTYVAVLDVSSNITDLQVAINAAEATLTLTTSKVSVTVAGQAATVPATARIVTVTNNAALSAAIAISTSGATDGQLILVRFYDFSAVVQTLSWTNTENSAVSAPVSSNGSTTLPITAGFQFNGQTNKWRCIGWS